MFIKYVCRVPLRMTDEQLLIADDAIHGEEAYCFSDDVEGIEPSITTRQLALEKGEQIRKSYEYHSKPGVPEGIDVEA